jgi:hypothetical protein
MFDGLAMLEFQFRNSEVESVDFSEGDQVDCTQGFDDLGSGCFLCVTAGVARFVRRAQRFPWSDFAA